MNVVWKERKRLGFLGLPWTFTVYTLTEEKILIDSGFFNKKQEETRLYRVIDLTVKRSFGQRIFGLGTVILSTSDKTTPVLELKNIKKAVDIKEQISDLVEKERVAKRVYAREDMHDHCGPEGGPEGPDGFEPDFDHDNN